MTFVDGERQPCTGLLVPVTLHQRSALAEQLGAVLAAPGPMAADAVEIDLMGATNVAGLSAAGDMTSTFPSVANAIAAGSYAAAMMVRGEGRGAARAARAGRAADPTRSGTSSTASATRSGAATPTPSWSARSTALAPGTALDLGCGEGDDASGWRSGAGG